MKFLSELLRNQYGDGWERLGTDVEVEALVTRLEAAVGPSIAASGPALLPSIALRAEEVVVAWLIARRMEDVLRTEGVCRMQAKGKQRGHAETAQDNNPSENESVFKEVHPMVEKAMKARERVRKALEELEEACKNTAATGGSGALAEEALPVLRLGDGVLDDALAFEKRKQKRSSSPARASRARTSKGKS